LIAVGFARIRGLAILKKNFLDVLIMVNMAVGIVFKISWELRIPANEPPMITMDGTSRAQWGF
jgi:hypothetical protein